MRSHRVHSPKIGRVSQTLNEWVCKHKIETGMRDGVASTERERVKALEREVKELHKANEIRGSSAHQFNQLGKHAEFGL